MSAVQLHLLTFGSALVACAAIMPACRWAALRWDILDYPHSAIKTHADPVPYLGGVAIAAGVILSLIAVSALTDFSSGTLRSLHGIFLGGSIIFLLGLIDDVAPKALGHRLKFAVQILAALCLIAFDFRIAFVKPVWFANVLTVVWVVGVINAFNIVDVMDGLAGGIALIASLGFLFIAFPSEPIHVDFAAAALAGALVAFLPFNLSRSRRIFMGDTGSHLLGFLLAAISLAASSLPANKAGFLAPIFILGVPIFDTFLVIVLRVRNGKSPFLGSNDHYAVRLQRWGLCPKEILVLSYAVSLALMFVAYQATVVDFERALMIYTLLVVLAFLLGAWLARIRID